MSHWPVPTSREVRWSFYVAAVCVLMFSATVCWAVVHKVSQSDGIVRIAASNAAQVDRLSEQIDAQAAESAQQRRQLKAQNRQVHAELTALLRYLRAHGIEVPRTALTPPTSPSRSTRPKGTTHSSPRPSHSPGTGTPTGSPSTTGTSTPTPSPDLLCEPLPTPLCALP